MEENLEIYFCEICSESIPAKDLVSRDALNVKGKVVGPCCLPEMQTGSAKSGVSVSGFTTLGAVLLAAIAGGTIYQEWRMSEEIRTLESKIQEVETNVASHGTQQFADVEKSLDQALRKEDLAAITKGVAAVSNSVTDSAASLSGKIGSLGARLGGLDETQKRIVDGQSAMKVAIKTVETEVLRLEREVARMAGTPRASVVDAAGPDAGPDVAPVPKGPDAAPGLPAALNHQVTRLKDPEDGTRFEAVDSLTQTKDMAALPYLLPMLKDPDAFVRRLTAEGLSSFSDKTTVDALIVALADPEEIVRHTAQESLVKLTKQAIEFESNGSTSQRNQGQRRWKDWWAKNRSSF